MKAISIVLITSMVFSCFACYSTRLVNQEDEIRNILKEKEGIYLLTTQSSEIYIFLNYKHKCVFENDTLYGRAKRIASESWQKFEQVKFPVSDIATIEIQEIDGTMTGIVIVSIGVGICIFVVTMSWLMLTTIKPLRAILSLYHKR